MTIQTILIGFFIFVICACVVKKSWAGAGITLAIGFVIVALWNDPTYWDKGGKSLMDSAMSILDIFKNGIPKQ